MQGAMRQKVRMLKTQRGVDDGEIRPTTYLEGNEYEIGPELLGSFIDLGIVELAGDPPEPPKSRQAAPANKSRGAAPENKGK